MSNDAAYLLLSTVEWRHFNHLTKFWYRKLLCWCRVLYEYFSDCFSLQVSRVWYGPRAQRILWFVRKYLNKCDHFSRFVSVFQLDALWLSIVRKLTRKLRQLKNSISRVLNPMNWPTWMGDTLRHSKGRVREFRRRRTCPETINVAHQDDWKGRRPNKMRELC